MRRGMYSYQKKIFKIDEHMGIAIAGLTADARYLSRYMRNECLNYRFTYVACSVLIIVYQHRNQKIFS